VSSQAGTLNRKIRASSGPSGDGPSGFSTSAPPGGPVSSQAGTLNRKIRACSGPSGDGPSGLHSALPPARLIPRELHLVESDNVLV
jgi:hypothetical protein